MASTTMTQKRGQIAYRTCFSSISWCGYKLDILKSGLQKYLRRRQLDKMLWCLSEIYLFKALASNAAEHKATKGIITNLINRIIIMLDEELLFAEWDKYLIVHTLIDKFEESQRDDFISLIKICRILCNARLLRRNSDINAYFNFGMRKNVEKPEILEQRKEGEDIDLWYFRNFKAYFKQRNRKCFYWMYKIYIGKREGDVRRFKRKENIYMIWDYLYKQAFGNKLLNRCLDYRIKEFFNKNKKERGIFLTAAVDLTLEKDNIKWDPELLINIPHVETSEVWEIFKDRKKIEFDDYVIDMHTSLGRRLGKNAINFMAEGATVVDEDQEFLEKEWREVYNEGKLASHAANIAEKKKRALKKANKVDCSKESKVSKEENKIAPEKEKTNREKMRALKYKRIKKLRGKPNFDDLEKNLEKIGNITFWSNIIKLCCENTCGNKVMCFEYEGEIWKESRKSMNYNRDYCVMDECKELFGLNKIGMKRVLADFRIERIGKSKKSWIDNWKTVMIKEGEEPVVYCLMNKIEPGTEAGKIKSKILKDRKLLKEYAKIGIIRGIFRVSDFNGRNVLVKDIGEGQIKLVSIDEGDIGKRLDIIGAREKWLIRALNKDKSIVNEILKEVNIKRDDIYLIMNKYKLSDELINEVRKNWDNLKVDLEGEGIEF